MKVACTVLEGESGGNPADLLRIKKERNKYVAMLADNFYSSKEQEKGGGPLMESEEFKKAMAFMDSFVIEDLASEVPVDEDGKGALARIKYGV